MIESLSFKREGIILKEQSFEGGEVTPWRGLLIFIRIVIESKMLHASAKLFAIEVAAL